jgi:hypothetical protein
MYPGSNHVVAGKLLPTLAMNRAQLLIASLQFVATIGMSPKSMMAWSLKK